ncbi:hypothetical protein BDP55DRAFT_325349 [Colletotrichum godetiae]|uniref:SET domain-containing protein n=1 Tax=Colletotrichum godetiae TaxID=1209918 RepID=A0AAJ0ACP3_9PEZI|nr:uncharacterized protein BDP55DRAFT_325349 [Colletotrichum godetiae]KAK1660104.1 hypothetical protein BDP55DRAFT_325349 [Colletotrichum godetiae]
MKRLLLLCIGLTHVLGNAQSEGGDALCVFPRPLAHPSICGIKGAVDPLTTTRDRVVSNSSALSVSSPWTNISRCSIGQPDSPEFCIYTKEDYGGKGIAIITEAVTANHIARSQGFTGENSLLGANQLLPKVKVAAIPGKEYGLVATERIARGEVILKETASLLVDYAVLEWMPRKQLEIMRAHAVGLLGSRHQSQVMNLSTHGYHGDEASTVAAIAKNNMFSISTNSSHTDDRFYALFAQTSRLNHDCRPNIDYWFDPRTLTQRTTALRDIVPGEELTISYVEPLQSRKDRQNRLHSNWGFSCSCHFCTQSDLKSEASDKRITRAYFLLEELKDHSSQSQATPQMAELLISLYNQEHNWSFLSEAYMLAAIEYNGVGEPWLATKYASLAIDAGLLSLWEDHRHVKDMEDLARDPWSHWSWTMRKH